MRLQRRNCNKMIGMGIMVISSNVLNNKYIFGINYFEVIGNKYIHTEGNINIYTYISIIYIYYIYIHIYIYIYIVLSYNSFIFYIYYDLSLYNIFCIRILYVLYIS